jgi:hypothetical protein
MAKNIGRIAAVSFFLLLLLGAIFCILKLGEDIYAGKYFNRPEEFRYEAAFLTSYILIILLVLRYGYYLAANKVSWKIIGDDFFYLLNKKYFGRVQWVINVILFWMAVAGFIYSLAISTMKGYL